MPKTNSLDTSKIEKKWPHSAEATRGKQVGYDQRLIERKWQDIWNKKGIYTPDINKSRKPFYNLWMFPYPSAEGLHAGHAFASTGSDIYGRFMRMHGYDVFQPIGYDSFGIHSENYAIKIGEPPQVVVDRTTKHYEEQLRSMGHGYDWTRTVTTSDPDYYKWTQWLFIQLFKAGLAKRAKAKVNWCPSCETVLSDEQVIDAKCERCRNVVTKKELEQWFFKITNYADRLLAGLNKIDWSERVVKAQREWIGRSIGMLIEFKSQNSCPAGRRAKGKIKVFTTRPDTLNAVTFLATSELYDPSFAKATEGKEKLGEFTGEYAVSPLDGRKIPIWKTNYVAPGYGTGVIMGVPAHDARDMEFAKKYHLDIVNKDPDKGLWEKIEKEGWGKRHTNFHLRDWLVSRQRYWGAPIPMIQCKKCGWQPVDEKDLPILLPEISDYKPEGTGKGPLANHPEFYETACPECGQPARRETDVMDTFVDSSWYFLRYPSTRSARSGQLPFDPEITKKWLPVDLYFGGAEHAVLHLMYARFVWMALKDLGYLKEDEPFPKFFAHGLMIKDGAKMSKSRGNVVNPDGYITKFGADTLRLYLMFMGPVDGYPDFRDTGIEGMHRFVERVRRLYDGRKEINLDGEDAKEVAIKMHQTIKKVTEDIQEFKYNTAIAAIMELVNVLTEYRVSSIKYLKPLALLLAPFAPHLAEEVWVEVLDQPFSIHTSSWPEYDSKYLKVERVTIVIQVNGKLRGQLELRRDEARNQAQVEAKAKLEPKIAAWLAKGNLKKVVFVPEKIINFVISH